MTVSSRFDSMAKRTPLPHRHSAVSASAVTPRTPRSGWQSFSQVFQRSRVVSPERAQPTRAKDTSSASRIMGQARHCAGAIAIALLLASAARATTFTVNSLLDDDDDNPGDCVCHTAGAVCTFRAAKSEANACSGADTIDINGIAGTVTSGVGNYDFTEQVTVTRTCTTPDGTFTLDCTGGGGTCTRLSSGSSGSTIRGLSVQHAAVDGLAIETAGNTIECNEFVDNEDNIFVTGASNIIGGISGASTRNRIALARHEGIHLSGLGAHDNVVEGNWVGVSANGLSAAANGFHGINVSTQSGGNPASNMIGGATSASRNIVSGNTGYGIAVAAGATNTTIRFDDIGLDSARACTLPNVSGRIDDAGTNTTLADLGVCPPLGCCGYDGTIDPGVGVNVSCFDNNAVGLIGGPTIASAPDCATIAGALGLNPSTAFHGDNDCTPMTADPSAGHTTGFNGVCQAPPAATNTPTPTATPVSGGATTRTPTIKVRLHHFEPGAHTPHGKRIGWLHWWWFIGWMAE